MRLAFFSTKPYDEQFFTAANERFGNELVFFEGRLDQNTTALAAGSPAICAFVNDRLDADVLAALAAGRTKWIALRSAGFNNVDLAAADELGLKIVRVPAYSPHAVAEHTIGLILTLNRKLHRAYSRVRDGNFSLNGLLGFDLFGRTVGIVGTGQIGICVAEAIKGFGCRLLGYDVVPNPHCLALGMEYVPLPQLLAQSDIVTLHCPLTPETRYLVNAGTIGLMKPGVMLINTSRGAVIDTKAVLEALKSGMIGYLGLDVYEEEADYFFEDLSGEVIEDDTLARLMTFPNVIITSHQAFFTREALEKIATTTLQNVRDLETAGSCINEVHSQQVRGKRTT
jgi:D-lactate dehydrogenase